MDAVQQGPWSGSHVRKSPEVRWELLAVFALNFGVWLLIVKVVALIAGKSSFA